MREPEVYSRLSEASAQAVASRLGLARFTDAGCVLDGVERIGRSLRFSFEWTGVGSGVVSVSAADGQPAFAGTRDLAIRFIGSSVSRPYAVLMARMAADAREMTIDDLLGLAGQAPVETGREVPKLQPYNPIVFWGQEDGWRRFMCDAAMERRFREAFEFDSDSSFIVHGDLECRFVAPGARVRLPGHFVYPFDLFSHNEAVGPITELDDRDVIVDSTVKIEQKVRREMADGAFRGPVVVISTCVPMIIAEDPTNVLARLEPVCPEGIRYVTPSSPVGPSELFMQSFGGLRASILGVPPIRMAVGLVGYRPGRARDELSSLLGRLGISVTGGMVPLVTRRLLAETLSAGTIVVAPSRYHEAMYAGLVDGATQAGRAKIMPDYPWGIDATARWLRAVATACGVTASVTEMLDGESRRVSGLVRSMAPDRVFLFVCGAEEMARLVDPLSPSGLPLVPFMRELGLRCRVLVFGGPAETLAAARTFESLSGIPAAGDLVEFSCFQDREALDARLRAGDAAAVYSEMFFDHRASRAGLPTFSSRIFEPGFDGAVRTAARFRRLAGLSFYRRYFSRSAI